MQRNVKPVKVADLTLDGKRIYIQSMLNVEAHDLEKSAAQAKELEAAGCEIIRAAIPDMKAVELVETLKNAVSIPVVADIHFDYRIALACAEAGIDKIRINPGNIGGEDKVKAVVKACRSRGIPIRIGVNGGSLEKDLLAKYGSCDFDDIVISIKSSNVETMIKAYRLLASQCSYPLHLGVTEAGTERMGIIKSAMGIGSLLIDGIGETIRVSLTDTPVKEIYAAKDILMAAGRGRGVKIVSCPTCGRTKIDLIGLANRVENALKGVEKDITVAVMGCVVNGIGEAGEADIGIAGGDGSAVLFAHGERLCKVSEDEALERLLEEVEKL